MSTVGRIILRAENISKQYRLGQYGTGTISHDLNRAWAKLRRKEDPYLKVGDVNNRSSVGGSDYVWSLKDINFEINQGEVLGIIGKNGAGKSTLLKILAQVTSPTTGKVKVKGRIAALLEVGTGFHPELTGRENIFLNGAILGMSKAEIKSKLDAIVDFSGVARYLETPVKRYSSGMMVRLGFAVAAHLEPEILIVDEVLAVGDAEFQSKCLGKMKDVAGEGRTVLFVSHNMSSIKSLCTRGVLLHQGMLVKDGPVEDIIDHYQGMVKFDSVVFPDTDSRPVVKINAWIKKLWMESGEGDIRNNFTSGSQMIIRAEYETQGYSSPISTLRIAFAISSVTGETIADLSNEFVEVERREYPMKGLITCRIPRLTLAEGRYKVNAFVSIGGIAQYWVKDVIGFEVERNNNFFGSGKVPDPKDGFFLFDQEWLIK